ncbi:MAG: hypothetical protein WDN06_21650 [Asticcacaulis sp.]
MAGSSLKASVSGLTKPIYNVAIAGHDLTLTPSDTTHPFAFQTAESFEAYLRPTANVADSGDFLLRVTRRPWPAAKHGGRPVAGEAAQPRCRRRAVAFFVVRRRGAGPSGDAMAQCRRARSRVSRRR